MSDFVPAVRGYRPSRFAPFDEGLAHRESLRLANLERYIVRARAGMPIFDENEQLSLPSAPSDQPSGSQII